MVYKVKVMAVGNSAGIILPKEALARLGVRKGDAVQLGFDGDTLCLLKADDPYNAAVAAGRDCFERYPTTLAALAK